MPIIAKDEGKVYHLPPMGNHQAVCFDVWDLGNQKSEMKGKMIVRHRIMIGWELTSEKIKSEDDQNGLPFRLYKRYTLSLNDRANLAKDLVSWMGRPLTEVDKKGFDLEFLVNSNCLINIVHNKVGDKTYANITNVSGLPKGMQLFRPQTLRSMPDWVKKIIDTGAQSAPEPEGDEAAADHENEEIPF